MEELDPLYLVIYQTASLSQRTFFPPFSLGSRQLISPCQGEIEHFNLLTSSHQKISPHASKISPHEKFPFRSVVLPLPRTFWVPSWRHGLAVDFVPFEAFTGAFTSLFRKKKVHGGGGVGGLEILQQTEDVLWIIQDTPWGIANTQHPRAGVTVNALISGLQGEPWCKQWAHLPPAAHAWEGVTLSGCTSASPGKLKSPRQGPSLANWMRSADSWARRPSELLQPLYMRLARILGPAGADSSGRR